LVLLSVNNVQQVVSTWVCICVCVGVF